MKEIITNKTVLIVINIILLILVVVCYKYIFDVEVTKRAFAEDSVNFVTENENPVFKISKIVLYSSGHAVDDSSDAQLKNIDISQFTDIAIYIDNKEKSDIITAENTINEMFIDNIKMETKSQKGDKRLNYKNPETFGKYVELDNYQDDGILFNVIHTNEENQNSNYDENIFYTDCSNPITLGYVNKNILTDCKVNSTNTSLAFDGSILKNANVDLNSIKPIITFAIHIKNNLGEEYVCNVKIDDDLSSEDGGIYTGYVMKIQSAEGKEYNFLKVSY